VAAWLERKRGWLPESSGGGQAPEQMERPYSVSEVAELLGVTRQTVYKWLSVDNPDDAVIPPAAWFRLPSGYIRIRKWAVESMVNEQ